MGKIGKLSPSLSRQGRPNNGANCKTTWKKVNRFIAGRHRRHYGTRQLSKLTQQQAAEQNEDEITVVGEQERDHVAADHGPEPARHQDQAERHCPRFVQCCRWVCCCCCCFFLWHACKTAKDCAVECIFSDSVTEKKWGGEEERKAKVRKKNRIVFINN